MNLSKTHLSSSAAYLRKKRTNVLKLNRFKIPLPLIYWASFSLLISVAFLSLNNSYASKVKLGVTQFMGPALVFLDKPYQFIQSKIHLFSSLQDRLTQHYQLEAMREKIKDITTLNACLTHHNQDLKKLLKALPSKSILIETGQIVQTNSFKTHHFLSVLTKNTNIKEDDIVVCSQGLVGRVTESLARVAQVIPLTHYQSRVPIYGGNNITFNGILCGSNQSLLTLEHIDKINSVRKGDILYTSGYGGIFPKGIAVGVVVETANNKTLVQPMFNLETTSDVSIIQKFGN